LSKVSNEVGVGEGSVPGNQGGGGFRSCGGGCRYKTMGKGGRTPRGRRRNLKGLRDSEIERREEGTPGGETGPVRKNGRRGKKGVFSPSRGKPRGEKKVRPGPGYLWRTGSMTLGTGGHGKKLRTGEGPKIITLKMAGEKKRTPFLLFQRKGEPEERQEWREKREGPSNEVKRQKTNRAPKARKKAESGKGGLCQKSTGEKKQEEKRHFSPVKRRKSFPGVKKKIPTTFSKPVERSGGGAALET